MPTGASASGAAVGSSDGQFTAITPARVLDTRIGLGGPKAAVSAGSTLAVSAAGRAGIPTSGVAAIVMTITVVNPQAAGYITASGHNLPRPATSNLNFTAGQTVANLVVVQPGADGKVDLFNGSSAATHLLVDISGYFVAPDHYSSSLGDAGRAFDNPSETALTPANVAGLQPAWNANQMSVSSYGSPALVDGIAYIAGHVPGQLSGELLAADAQTGQTLWTASTPDCDSPANGLTVAGGMAFIGCNNSGAGTPRGGFVVAVDLSAHQQVWSRKVAPFQTGNPAVADGMVITGSQSDESGGALSILGLDAHDHQIRFQIAGLPVASTHSLAKNGQLIVSTEGTNPNTGPLPATLRVYDDTTGALRWTGTGDHVFGTVTVDAGHILVTDYDSSVSEWSEGGCGRTACAENWTTSLKAANDPRQCYLQPGGADGHTVAVTVRCTASRIVLVDESTGAIANTIPMPAGTLADKGAVRSGNLLWLPVWGDGSAPYPAGIQAFAADCTTNCQPSVNLVGNGAGGSPAPSIAIAGGTVLIQTWMSGPASTGQVLAYRL
jgi:hypothetical protein